MTDVAGQRMTKPKQERIDIVADARESETPADRIQQILCCADRS